MRTSRNQHSVIPPWVVGRDHEALARSVPGLVEQLTAGEPQRTVRHAEILAREVVEVLACLTGRHAPLDLLLHQGALDLANELEQLGAVDADHRGLVAATTGPLDVGVVRGQLEAVVSPGWPLRSETLQLRERGRPGGVHGRIVTRRPGFIARIHADADDENQPGVCSFSTHART
jgi:ATP-dependent helicase YprA (DUF1998 family)